MALKIFLSSTVIVEISIHFISYFKIHEGNNDIENLSAEYLEIGLKLEETTLKFNCIDDIIFWILNLLNIVP